MKNIYLILTCCLFLSACSLLPNTSGPQYQSVTPDVQGALWAKKWWQKRHQEKLIEKEQMEKVDLVFLGDSITHAWENKGKAVWADYYQSRNALNLGFSGDRTEQVLWRLQHGAVDNISPKLVVLMIGTNNTGHRDDPAQQTAAGIKAIIDELATRLPTSKVLLLAIFPRGKDKTDPKRQLNTQINELIAKYDSDQQVRFLNINDIFLDDNGVLSPSVMKDYLHPNPEQYLFWAKAIEPSIANLMQ
ncbi:MAG: platelet-activating factor acetylhydrolase IB subunit [Thalassotalea sp.]